MSNTRNIEWLENATDNFREAVSQGNWGHARAVVEDIEGYGFNASELRRQMNKAMYQSTKSRRIYPPTECSFSSRDCHEEDCSCRQFSRGFAVKVKKSSIFSLSRALGTIIGKEPKEMVWNRGNILITSLPSKALTF